MLKLSAENGGTDVRPFAEATPSLKPPDDASITTLYIGGMDARVDEGTLKDQFYSYGELKSIRVVHARNCAFVTYTDRKGAEKATEAGIPLH